ncbi:MAG: ATP-binding protein [Candidatus Binataceae bacterium]
MEPIFPALNLKAKLILLMVALLGLTLGAEVWVSIGTQEAVVENTQEKVKDLASAIEISVQELTSVAATDRDRLHHYIASLHTSGLEVSIASSQNLILNSSNPGLIGAALDPKQTKWLAAQQVTHPGSLITIPASKFDSQRPGTTVYLIPVEVENHLLGYVQVAANFGDFAQPLKEDRTRQLEISLIIFAIGLLFAYLLADRYVKPIHAVARAAQNTAAHGLECVPEAHRRDEIGLLTHSFNEMVGQLRRVREREQELNRLERFTALGQLAGGLAHEIKNPLNFISLALDQLRARYAPREPRDREAFIRQMGMMKDEMRRLSELVQSFLHYGMPVKIHPAPTDVRRIVNEVTALSESKMKSQGIELVIEDAGAPANLTGDAEKLRTGFVNVIANAIQAMPDGGTLRIAFRGTENGAMAIDFSDTGAGLEPGAAGKVFDPFFTTKREGIGLGLFLTKAIAEGHGGSIAIGPSPAGRGTTLTFTFPPNAVERAA